MYDKFGSFREALKNRTELLKLLGPKRTQAVLQASAEEGERELEEAKRMGIRIKTFLDEDFPSKLQTFSNLPVVIYYKGDLSILDGKTVAVVGTRYPSEDAKTLAYNISKELARRGVVVVSGGAYGIDTHAHRGALESGRTAVVLGSGFAYTYPKENRGLFSNVVEKGGVILSEFPLKTKPLQGNFPARNRVISALSDVVVVVQAPAKSGALITASWALDQGKDVWVVPFSPLDRRAYGSNKLLYDGAKPLYDLDIFMEEVIGALPLPMASPKPVDLNELEAFLLQTLREPLHIDEIAYRTGLNPTRLYSTLLNLQMKGLIQELPGKIYRAL